jgi:hypothetical protein
MIENVNQLKATMEQMGHVIRALEDLRTNVLPRDPRLFGTMAEAPLDDLDRLRREVSDYLGEMKQAS